MATDITGDYTNSIAVLNIPTGRIEITYNSREQVQEAYRLKFQAVAQMIRDAALSGAIYTQTTDVEGEVNGLLTYDRRVEKLPRGWLRSLHGSLGGDG